MMVAVSQDQNRWRDPSKWGVWVPSPQPMHPPSEGPSFVEVPDGSRSDHVLVFASSMTAVSEARMVALADDRPPGRQVALWAWGLSEFAVLSCEDDMPVVVGAGITDEDVFAAVESWDGPTEMTLLCEGLERVFELVPEV